MAHIQPAKMGYFFRQGYTDIKRVIIETFDQIKKGISEYSIKMKYSRALKKVFYIGVIVTLWLFGGLVCLLISAIHCAVIFLFMLLYYALFLIILLIDRLYLAVKKIGISCYECHEKSMYPIHVCPNCDERHDRLTASVYGAIQRTCNCGYKLPTSILNVKKKRRDLKAFCPKCAMNGRETVLLDRESRPICIPVIGGTSVGKSAFITAYATVFIDKISVDKGVKIELYDKIRTANAFNAMRNFFRSGQIVKTAVQTDVNRPSSIAFSYFVKHRSLRPERLVHIYDIAGEAFVGGENEMQKQYDYCDGIILVLDPFSIPDVMARFGSQLNNTDLAQTSTVSVDTVMDKFILKLEKTTNLSRGKILSTPLAVVLNKTDEANLSYIIGGFAVKKVMDKYPETFTDFYDTMDYLCREFLKKTDMYNVLADIQRNFKKTRFFAVSAIGHTLNKGRYIPHHVTPVVNWIIARKDRKLASVISTTKFSDKKMPIVSDIETINLDEHIT